MAFFVRYLLRTYLPLRYNKKAMNKKRATSYRLSLEAFRLIEKLAKELGISRAGVIEMAVRQMARAGGIK